MRKSFQLLRDDILLWWAGWYNYGSRRLRRFGAWFETNKDILVDILMARRGGYQRPFLHFSISVLVLTAILSAPILANAYPGGSTGVLADFTPPSAVVSSLDLSDYGIQTQVSEKPRDQTITYSIQSGDTLSTIAQKFNVSIDTIKWANDIKDDSLTIGDTLKIPPVTGIVVKVQEGDTIYSIAKKYRTDAQKILNFPFNDFADLNTFALSVGQTLIVPDGVMPDSAPAVYPLSIAAAVVQARGLLSWPTVGVITQCPIWYHMAFDIANPSQPPILAAADGTVILVQYLTYGYGRHAIIAHDNGYQTLYGHMTEIYVKQGDRVSRGQVIGKMGSTGRSTGTHLHFEVRKDGTLLNPTGFFSTQCGG
jgi:murein DD-endopeptidase MepM/ murein hydrolase activator NlpD